MATYYVTVGGAGTNSGADEANAFTMAQATAQTGTGNKFWVKAGTYTTDDSASSSVMDMDVAGEDGAWNEWEAYTTTIGDFTIGDAQPVVIDANANTLTNPIQFTTIAAGAYTRIRGFRFWGGSSHGVDANSATDFLTLEGCKIDSNGGRGIQWDNYLTLVGCEITGNTTNAIDTDTDFLMFGCKIHNENASPDVVTCLAVIAINNVFYNNANAKNIAATSGYGNVFIGNTFDGDGQAANNAISVTGGGGQIALLYNNIFFDFDTAVNFVTASSEEIMSRGYNLFFSNTTDYDSASLHSSDITGTSDPFTDSTNRDYSLKTASEALDAGIDGGAV